MVKSSYALHGGVHTYTFACAFTGVEKYDSYDVLEDVEFKEAVKKYS